MRGSITKKRGKWWLVLDLGPDPESGRRRRPWHGPFDTKRAAELAQGETTDRRGKGSYVAPSKLTVDEYLADWLPGQASHLRPSTFSLYRTVSASYLSPTMGAEPIQGLTPKSVGKVYAGLLAKGGRGGKPLAPKTVRHAHIVLRRALADAVEEGIVTRNVAALAKVPAARRRDMQTWTGSQVAAFLDAAREGEPRLAAAFTLAATTGMRRGEVLGLRWSDLDLDAARAQIVRALVIVDNRPTLSEPKTERGRRSVPLPPETVAVLRAHKVRQAEERLALGLGAAPADGLVFAREDGSPLHPERLIDAFARVTKTAKLPPIRFHDLRHSFATLALAAGIAPKVVQEILGHASITITLDLYSHVVPGMDEAATSKVAALIFGGPT